MKDETKSIVTTTQVVAEIHHHYQQLTEPTDIKDVINELEIQCTKKLGEITLVTTNISPITKSAGDPDLSPDLIVESSEFPDDKSLWEDDGCSSSFDEIETDCSDLTSNRTDSYSSGESSDARSPAPGHLSPSSSTHRRRSVSLTDDCCGLVDETGDEGVIIHNCDGGCNGLNVGIRGGSGVGIGGGCGGHNVGHYGHGLGPRGSGGCDASKMCSSSMGCTSHGGSYVRYDRPSQVPYNRNPKTAGLNFNTNLRKPPENWLRMRLQAQGSGHNGWGRHGPPYWSYPYSKTSSWAMFAYRYSGRGRRPFHKGLANNLVCLCCGCCNCSRVNQTCCCCCYHCVHRISSCRRPDLTKPNRPLCAVGPGGPRKSVSNSLQAGASEGEPSGMGEPSGSGQGACGQGGGENESGLESGMDSGTESTSGKASERSKKKSSSGSGKSSTTTPSNETMPKSYKLSTLF